MENTFEQFEVVTPNPHMGGEVESDTIGDNEPRSYAECEADVSAFRRGACGADFVHGTYGIRSLLTGSVDLLPDPDPDPIIECLDDDAAWEALAADKVCFDERTFDWFPTHIWAGDTCSRCGRKQPVAIAPSE